MSDTPVYDALKLDPTRRGRRPVLVHRHTALVPLDDAVVQALSKWHARHHSDLAAVLEPFGLHPYDIAAPTYQRIVYLDETLRITIHGKRILWPNEA